MLRLLQAESDAAISVFEEKAASGALEVKPRHVTSVCGTLAAPFIEEVMNKTAAAFPRIRVDVVPVVNHFFGESITVTGLVTGRDLIAALLERKRRGEDLGEEILVPVNMLRAGERVFLDDRTVEDVERETGLPVRVVWDSGEDTVRAALGLAPGKNEDRQTYE